ncbi:PREB protein, partial [Mohoua ochrocephala]|nr:PREB protein [Mohoua ochrocephala]
KKTLEFRAHDGEIEDIALGPDNKVELPAAADAALWLRGGLLPLHQVPQGQWVWGGGHGSPRSLPSPHSDSGTFLGLGTVTGSVAIHIAFSLQVSWGRGVGQPPWPPSSPSPPVSPQRLYYVKEAHGIVVTDVAFVPESRPGRELLGGHEAALLSVAVDSRCKLHLLPTRRSLPVWLLLLLCAGLIVATILLLQLAFPGFL